MKGRFTDKQKRFVAEYLIDLNATQAAMRAGYSPKTANEQGPRLLTKTNIREAIEAGRQAHLAKLEITKERVLEEIACIAYSDITDYVRDDGTIDWPLIKSLPRQKRVAIQKLIVETTGGGSGGRPIVERTRFECASKIQALELLGRHLKLFTDKHEHTGKDGGPLQARPLSDFYAANSLADLAVEIQRERAAKELPGGDDGYNN